MKIILIALMLTSCATSYKVKRCTVIESIETCSTAQIKSRREFPQGVEVVYEKGRFIFRANQVSNTVSPLEKLGLDVARAAASTALNQINKED